MPKGTTLRNVRIPDALWDAALLRAEQEETTVSEMIRAMLQAWVDSD